MMQYLGQRENLHDDSPSLSYTQPANNNNTVKHVLSSHSKIDKTKLLMIFGSLLKVESQYF